jgi:2-polyprenyl-6-methoxyphenol hydroxylase-like FAD-dependent oxidoreductase
MTLSSDYDFDVIIVGARCAGASLASELAQAGRRVLVLDRAEFPSDAFSTHLIQADGVEFLRRHGVLERVAEAGAPLLSQVRVIFDGVEINEHYRSTDPSPGAMSISRKVLDAALCDHAVASGATLLTRAEFRDVCIENGRLVGIGVLTAEGHRVIRAPLVVGADGRLSQLGSSVNARSYNSAPGERFIYWADFVGSTPSPQMLSIRTGDFQWAAYPSDAGVLTVAVVPPMRVYEQFMTDPVASFDQLVESEEPLRSLIGDGIRTNRPRGTIALDSFFREAAGPGWCLVGDAGVFKDPVLGQGIGDAFRQSSALAGFLDGVDLSRSQAVDHALLQFWRWRDRDLTDMYWLAVDAAEQRSLNRLETAMFSTLKDNRELAHTLAVEIPAHWSSSGKVFNVRTVLRALPEARRLPRRHQQTLVRILCERVALQLRRDLSAATRRRKLRPLTVSDPVGLELLAVEVPLEVAKSEIQAPAHGEPQ